MQNKFIKCQKNHSLVNNVIHIKNMCQVCEFMNKKCCLKYINFNYFSFK